MKRFFNTVALLCILCAVSIAQTGCFQIKQSAEKERLTEIISHFNDYKADLEKAGYPVEIKTVPGRNPDELRFMGDSNVVYIYDELGYDCSIKKNTTDDSTRITTHFKMIVWLDRSDDLVDVYLTTYRDYQKESQKTLKEYGCEYMAPDFENGCISSDYGDEESMNRENSRIKEYISSEEMLAYYQNSQAILNCIKEIELRNY